MILKEVSKYIQQHTDDILENKTTALKLLCEWIILVIKRTPQNNAEKIIHRELMLAENKSGDFLIIGKSDSGRVLMNALNNFAASYENYLMSRWLADKKPHHFTNYPDKEN